MRFFGCFWRLLVLAALAALIGVAWLQAPAAWERLGPEGDAGAEPSTEDLSRLVDRYEQARSAGAGEMEVSEAELLSLLRLAAGDQLPAGVVPRSVELQGGEASVGIGIDLASGVGSGWPGWVVRGLPPSLPLVVHGTALPSRDGEAVFLIRRISLAGLPVPRSIFGYLAPDGGVDGSPGLPAEAILVSLPPGIAAVYIEEGRLRLPLQP